jgi:hypothetical protein
MTPLTAWSCIRLWGMLLLAVTLFLMFQAVFSLATVPMEWIKTGVDALGNLIRSGLPPGVLQSLLVDGILAGTGGVLVFLPQILILFLLHHCARRLGLSAARGVPAGPRHGDGRSVGAIVHSAAVQLCLRHPRRHGHPDHQPLARPPGHHHDCAADDVLGHGCRSMRC